jgi:hypothetical protein
MNEENTPEVPQVAPAGEEAQIETPAGGEIPENAPAPIEADKEEKVYAGKFKSPDELEKAYKELQSSFTKARQRPAEPVVPVVNEPTSVEHFDRETQESLNRWYSEQRRAEMAAAEESKVAAFVEKHKDDLSDEIVDGLVRKYIADARAEGKYLEQEQALQMAKEKVATGVKPQLEQAKSEGLEEGRNISKTKEELGAVGSPASKMKIDPSQLSAKEFAEYHGLKKME